MMNANQRFLAKIGKRKVVSKFLWFIMVAAKNKNACRKTSLYIKILIVTKVTESWMVCVLGSPRGELSDRPTGALLPVLEEEPVPILHLLPRHPHLSPLCVHHHAIDIWGKLMNPLIQENFGMEDFFFIILWKILYSFAYTCIAFTSKCY